MKTSVIIGLLVYIFVMIYNKIQTTEELKVNTINAVLIGTAAGLGHFYLNDMEDVINEPF